MLVPESRQIVKDQKLNSIDAPWLIEYLEEKFENAISMLKEDCIIYGGAVRDLLAELPIGGDLDIIVPRDSYSVVATKFISSFRWIESRLTQIDALGYQSTPVEQTHTFMNLNKDLVQLISPDNFGAKDGQTIQGFGMSSMKIIQEVDIRCCGVMSDIYGNVYEVLPGAYEDCINKELNLNDNIEISSKKALKSRIEKLEKRGWKNNINVPEVKEAKTERIETNWR